MGAGGTGGGTGCREGRGRGCVARGVGRGNDVQLVAFWVLYSRALHTWGEFRSADVMGRAKKRVGGARGSRVYRWMP